MPDITSARKVRYDAIAGLERAVNDTVNALVGPMLESASMAAQALSGREGLSPTEQAQRFVAAADAVATAAARAPLGGMSDETGALFASVAQMLRDAATFVVERDFDAHMAAKSAAGDGALASLTGDGFVLPDEQVGDALASMLSDDLGS